MIRPQLLQGDTREGEDVGGLPKDSGGVKVSPCVGDILTGGGDGGTVEGDIVTQQHRGRLGRSDGQVQKSCS